MSDEKKPDLKAFSPVGFADIPVNSEGFAIVDLFVFLSLQKRFILYIPKGERVTQQRKEALARHSVPTLYIRESDASAAACFQEEGTDPGIQNFEVIGLPGNVALKNVFESLSQNLDAPPIETIQKLESMADSILTTVAPEASTLKARFSQNMDYLWLMNDASAISTLATMFAAANGINSVKPLRDIVFASLVMDLPLAKLEPAQVDAFYANPAGSPKTLADQIREHPFQAYQLAKKALPHLNDVTFELILVHHEKYNGLGYPRQLRSVQIFPLGQIFSAAVEAFEIMKSGSKNNKKNLDEVLRSLLEATIEPHLQKHRKEIIYNVAKFLGINLAPPTKPAPPTP